VQAGAPRVAALTRILSHVPAWMDPVLPPDLDNRPKIFGIGFHKTGTTSLGRALRLLGYRVQKGFTFNAPRKRIVIPEPVTLEKIRGAAFPLVRYYSAFEDNPWPLLFKEVDKAFPGSRFILTHRDPERWYRSASQFHKGRPSPMLDFIYGGRDFEISENKDIAITRFNAHKEAVEAYFRNRPDDLLCWDLESEPRWETLCGFLRLGVPSQEFPHGKRQAQP
jgi:Sulfotransferase domain